MHLAGELMQQLTGIEMVHVPYKGIALAMTAILAGDIQITYATPISAYQHLKNGRLIGTYRTEDVTEDEVLGMIIAGKRPEGKEQAHR